MNNTLESHKLFPYIAWSIVIGFAVFTYYITVTVRAELEAISTGITRLEAKIDTLESEEASKNVSPQ